jgi:hypothetical protein
VTDVFQWANEVFVGFVLDLGLMSNMSTSEFPFPLGGASSYVRALNFLILAKRRARSVYENFHMTHSRFTDVIGSNDKINFCPQKTLECILSLTGNNRPGHYKL